MSEGRKDTGTANAHARRTHPRVTDGSVLFDLGRTIHAAIANNQR